MAVKIIFCYAREDELLLEKLKAHLAPLQHQGYIDMWHDRNISAGTEWEHAIDEHLDTAQLILLLISSDFLASKYCYSVEMQKALDRHEAGSAKVIPIILRSVYWQIEPLRKLQALPTDAKAITSWYNLDEAFLDVTAGIQNVVKELSTPSPKVSLDMPKSELTVPIQDIPIREPQRPVPSFAPEALTLLGTLTGHSDAVLSIAISPDGQTLVSGSSDETIKLWHLPDRQLLYTFEGHSGIVESVTIGPDGQTFASGSFDGTIKLWNLRTKKFLYTLGKHSDSVTSVAISSDGKILASGSFDGTMKLWNLPTKKLSGDLVQQRSPRKLFDILTDHSFNVLSVAISPDGQILASGDSESTIKLWNLQTIQQVGTLEGHSSIVNSVAINPDGQILASGSDDKTIILWNIANRQRLHELKGHTESVVSVAVSPNGQILATGSKDKTIKIWYLHTGELHCTLENSVPVWSVVFSPQELILASGGSDGTIKIWKYTPG